MTSRLRSLLHVEVDIAWLAAFRVLFGLTMTVSMGRLIAYGWIDDLFVRPSYHFTYFGFSWIEPLSPPLMYALSWALLALALSVTLGFCFRASALLFCLGFTYLQLIDVTTYLNHYYLASLLAGLLALSPAHRRASLDSLLRPHLRADRVPQFWLYLLRFQVATVYTFAGLAKANADWLIHGQPLRIWLSSRGETPLLGPLFSHELTPLLMSWAGFLFDTSIAWLLMARRTRPFAYGLVILFHLATGMLFQIGMFPVIMVLSALIFFPPEWPRRLLGWLGLRVKTSSLGVSVASPRRYAVVLAGLYCALQLLVPLRFLAYGGNVGWHEQGMRFSWRVLLREKNGSVTYLVRKRGERRTLQVPASRYLTWEQERDFSGQPDLILQLAHHIERDFEARGRGPVEVRVEAFVSLNGRRSAPLIDPAVDLTQVDDSLARAAWILPAPHEAPPRIRPVI